MQFIRQKQMGGSSNKFLINWIHRYICHLETSQIIQLLIKTENEKITTDYDFLYGNLWSCFFSGNREQKLDISIESFSTFKHQLDSFISIF